MILGIAAYVFCGATGLSAQGGEDLFVGQIALCTCAGPGAQMPAAAKVASAVRCPPPCSNTDAQYVLANAKTKTAFLFDKQDLPKAFAGQNAFVIGKLDGPNGTIRVNTILPDLPPRIKQAKTVAIVCDACPRAMGKAKRSALEEVTGWNRYAVVPDPKHADLIFLFSANRYQGDYLTRKGPDPRPVHVGTTYMNILDPRTGQSLWGDAERGGSFFVGTETRDLVDELKEWLEAEDHPDERKLFVERHKSMKKITDTGK